MVVTRVLPPWPGRSLDEIAAHLDGECEWFGTTGVLEAWLLKVADVYAAHGIVGAVCEVALGRLGPAVGVSQF